ncbi:hypothetical protein IV203_036300 [Nitzschia inconspicua]|uniref:Uncharacterized protein n=1 Tax=Nitzschia inconspicua TaxID=303405 RepID=A0A9K3LG44_9STRA|nr:hypothetical protein IV203_006704 [Nitzschia inconspicua]KAG7361200.1 hypothetical protein IV203_036300 [Nitzschia inconspicua]
MASPSSNSKIQRPKSKQNQPTRSAEQTRSSIAKNDSGNSSKRESSQSFHIERESIFANRDNSDFKWQRSKYVVGALEVKSEPVFDPREDMMPRYKAGFKIPLKKPCRRGKN